LNFFDNNTSGFDMIKGIYNSAAGMLPRMLQQEVIANNLANASTAGFKKDRLFLKTVLDGSLVLQKDHMQNPQILNAERVATVFSQGALRDTGNPLDFALTGPGFFAVETSDGTVYTRAGSFTMTPEGDLVTSTGNAVLGEGGAINLPQGDVVVTPGGAVLVNGEEIDRLKLVEFDNTDQLVKRADNLYSAGSDAAQKEATATTVNQRFLEDSNVEAIQEMVDMISLHRAYQASARALMAQDETLQKAVNQIAAVR
jgi:flagellar basal-body rod protein FlgF